MAKLLPPQRPFVGKKNIRAAAMSSVYFVRERLQLGEWQYDLFLLILKEY